MTEWPPYTKPFRANPPEGSVAIVLPVHDGLRFFKLTYHSILAFTDHRYMLTLVDNMSGFRTRQYLESIRHNHAINVLQYQKEHSLGAEWNLGVRFMFAFATVKYAVCLTPTVVVEPCWLSSVVRAIHTFEDHRPIVPESNVDNSHLIGFTRELYERLGGFNESSKDPTLEFIAEAGGVTHAKTFVHKILMNGFDAKEESVSEKQEALS